MAQLAEIIYDEELMPCIIKIIDRANDYLVLVSPYNNYTNNLRDALERAARREVRITAVCRKDRAKDESAQLEWLSSNLGATVHLVERLHAKIYFNEYAGIVTSMNLLESSANNSKEIGFIIEDRKTLREIEDYVLERLVEHSNPVAPPRNTSKPKPPAARAPAAEPAQTIALGLCIRCGEEGISFDPDAPLCRKCYRNWNRYKDPDYPESYCHLCGEERANISFAKPLCRSCYRKMTNAT